MLLRTADRDPTGRCPSFRRHFDLHLAGEIFTGDRVRIFHDLLGCSGRDHLTAVFAGARTDIDNEIGRTHRILIMLDDEHRVTEITEMLERCNQTVIVSLVKSDGWFVQDINNADKAGADLRCKTDTLGFAAGECPRRPGECQIVKTDIHKELRSGLYFLQNLITDFMLHFSQLESRCPVIKFPD